MRFFKAGLFLSAGIIIHQLHKLETEETKFDSQDMRVMGGLRKKLPITFFAFLFCSLALVGLPGFSGFISKDAILLDLAVWSDIKAGGFYIPEVLAFATVLFTSFYTFRMIFLVFFGEFKLPRITGADDIGDKLKEGNLNLIIPALILAVLSLSFAFIGFGFNAENSWITDALPTPVYLIPTSYAAQSLVDIGEEVFKNLRSLVTLIATGLALIGIIIAYVAYRPNAKLEQSFIEKREPKGMLGQVSFYNWYLDTFYRKAILRFFMLFSKSSNWFDRKVIDGMVNLISKVTVVAAHLSKWFDRYFIDGLVNLSANVVGRVGQATRSIREAMFSYTLH